MGLVLTQGGHPSQGQGTTGPHLPVIIARCPCLALPGTGDLTQPLTMDRDAHPAGDGGMMLP